MKQPAAKAVILAATATITWTLAAADALRVMMGQQAHLALSNLNLAVAITSGAWLLTLRRTRPVDIAFDLGFERGQRLGYERGHRDALRETGNCLCVAAEGASSEGKPLHRVQVSLRQPGLNGSAQEPCPYRSQD